MQEGERQARSPSDASPRGLARAALAVVLAESAPVLVVSPTASRIELRRVLDLVLRHADEHLGVLDVDPLDGPGRDHDLAAEDPWTRVDHDGRAADLVC